MKTAEELLDKWLDSEDDLSTIDPSPQQLREHRISQIKQIQLDAMKEGARRAKIKCDSLAEKAIEEGWPHTYADAQMLGKAILADAEQWIDEDLLPAEENL